MLDARDTVEVIGIQESSRQASPSASSSRQESRRAPEEPIRVPRVFSAPGVDPFDEVEWASRTASIIDEKGGVLFEQKDVEVPTSWSMLATNIVSSKYFYGEIGTEQRERSLRQLIHRVTRTIADWGVEDGLFASEEDAETFYAELTWLCLHQHGAFNSPVWFNCGLYHQYGIGVNSEAGNYHYDPEAESVRRASTQYEFPQCSACFIQSVEDTMDGIMELARSEAMLFKFGSGTGTDLSTIRSQRERMRGGGRPSGPLSFLKVYDAIASVVKSGGKTRRAAKMNTLKCHHPDILEFIRAKPAEEKKAWALIEHGYSGDFNGEAYGSISFQNENLSVRVTDQFMQAALNDEDWPTQWVTDPDTPGPTYLARELLQEIAEGTWICGDPGLQFEDTIQRWHTCTEDGAIHSSNPCSEYMFLDDTACNLASLNLVAFLDADGRFDVDRFKAAVDVFITAQELIVDHASYPTERIALNSHRYRTLGLGYANLGALLMSLGLAYDSEEGRSLAASITAIMHGRAYAQSARLARALGPFEAYESNRGPMLRVLERHQDASESLPESCPRYLRDAARAGMREAFDLGRLHGYRNAQVTVLAPTGTIGFMMDCDTTGVEPDIALVKYKLLAGGGLLKIVNGTVPRALKRLGYGDEAVRTVVQYIDQQDTIEGAPGLRDEDLSVFDCAFKPRNGERYIPYLAHVKMMAAVQPFLSGAISKTVNMPEEATVEEVAETYIEGWRLGLKALAIYRDGCKRSQPVRTEGGSHPPEEGAGRGNSTGSRPGGSDVATQPLRQRMPATRKSITHRFEISGHAGYLTVGLYDDGSPGELFINMAKEGSTIGGLMDCFGTAISLCLQHGVPVRELVDKFAHTRFEPSGFTKNADIPYAKSFADYIFRWLEHEFGNPQTQLAFPEVSAPAPGRAPARPDPRIDNQFQHFMADAPVCDQCGSITVRNGSCYRCFNCGNSMGCS